MPLLPGGVMLVIGGRIYSKAVGNKRWIASGRTVLDRKAVGPSAMMLPAATGILERAGALDRLCVLGVAGAVLLAAALVREIPRRRAGRPWTTRESLALAGGVLLGFAGVVASVLLAPRGLSPRLWDPVLLLAALGLGWWRPLRRGGWWVGCAVGIIAGALAGPMVLPANPVLAGAEEPRTGAAVEVAWNL
ncbi:MAG TPA: hypothetical protein VM285_10560, partial [Polyangia bacterium]|nr:hypothetical protein [Polyangia bacterium]